MNDSEDIRGLTAHLFREHSGKMAAVLSRMLGLQRIDVVMDVIQDTFETALTRWRYSGIPENPPAWLMTVARNKALNTIKRESKTRSFTPHSGTAEVDESFEQRFELLLSPEEIKDSQLRLLFTCCHPDLSPKNQVITTLYILCGFGVPEISNAMLMQDEAVKKALIRSKAILRKVDEIIQQKLSRLSENRVETIQTILYLMFNEGYKTTRSKTAISNDLCYEAIRLTLLLDRENDKTNGDTGALLALMFFNLSRFPARLDTNDAWLTLEEQDRGRWNKAFIEEGHHYLNRTARPEKLSRFYIEAIIASLHCSAPVFEQTNWKKIAYLYRQLELLEPASPLVTLNRVIAESYLPEPADGIRTIEELGATGLLRGNFLVPAAKGDIYRRRGDLPRARAEYERALGLSLSPADRKFLERKINQCLQQS